MDRRLQLALVAVIALLTPGCEIIGDIFQAGIVVGIIVIVIIVAIVMWLFRKLSGGGRRPPRA